MEQKIVRRGSMKPLVTGVIVGAAVGATLGLLFAPKPGKETRKQIGTAVHKVRERFSHHPVETHSGSYSDN